MLNREFDETIVIDKTVEFIRTEIKNAGLNGAVIGISGGIDSAVVAYLTVKAIGKENITLIHLPENDLDPVHTTDAEIVADDLDIKMKIINISTILDIIMESLPDLKNNKLAKGNLKARIRAVILYSVANVENKMVIGTSNKSELQIGYGTKYGDLAADIWPIGRIYKTELYKIAKKLNINNKIITKAPTAGLWKDQTDEDEIGTPYEKLDKFLNGLENGKDEEILVKELNLSLEQIIRIKNLIDKNKHKSRMPKMLDFTDLVS